MFSRAHLLIKREIDNFKKDKPWGILLVPLEEDNMFHWVVKMKGLRETVWEDGIFTLFIKFDEHFNETPPQVVFYTIPFHPNIDRKTGLPCLTFLESYASWQSDKCTLTYILLSLQSLLATAQMKNPVNVEAADMVLKNPEGYRELALQCVLASHKMDDVTSEMFASVFGPDGVVDPNKLLTSTDAETPDYLESRVRFKVPEGQKVPKVEESVTRVFQGGVAKLSFEDYHLTWSGIATSKAKQDLKNPLLEAIKDNPALQRAHLGLPKEEVEDQMKRQIEEHENLMYGRFRNRPTEAEEKAAKLARLNKMKKIYLPPRISPTGFHQETVPGPPPTKQGKEEPWEQEVDDLVNWSSKLDANALEG